jgi:dihydrofolate synthase/folylpolyglutamate synthase
VLADKDIGAMVEPLRHRVDVWMVAPPQDRRALALDRLQGALVEHGVSPVLGFDRLEQALAAARQEARPGDRILVFGSFITVAEVGRLL